MLNEYVCLFCKHRPRTFCVPGLSWVNAETVTTSVTVLRNPWARQGSGVTADIGTRGPSSPGTQSSGPVQEGFGESAMPVWGPRACVRGPGGRPAVRVEGTAGAKAETQGRGCVLRGCLAYWEEKSRKPVRLGKALYVMLRIRTKLREPAK